MEERIIADFELIRQDDLYLVERKGRYFKVGLLEGELLSKRLEGYSDEEIACKMKMTKEDVERFFEEAEKAGIIGAEKKEKKNILFYKIPLIEADRFMKMLSDCLRRIDSRVLKFMFAFTTLIMMAGIADTIVNYKSITEIEVISLPAYQYAVLYAMFVLTIVIHETSHGVTCRYFGGKVGKIGFILLLFQPAFYCDISGVRRIKSRKKQVLTSFAGIYSNLFLMSISMFAFQMTGHKILGLFVLGNASIVLYNIIPLVKLDGYWMLSFATDITNLYDKSRKGVRMIIDGKNFKERFIGVYGIVTYGFIIMAIGSLFYSFITALV
ncbi:MAG: M50 family metallopeptidase [Lachnospiraceae bacterium]|nr:M50 family metallopeptidase [Lachnospiraceae bacterium]